jgi:hypothetical protein
MKPQFLMTLAMLVIILQPTLVLTASGYSTVLQPQEYGNTVITWSVIDAPEHSFGWWGPDFVFVGNWLATDGSKMTFEVTRIGESGTYLTGSLSLGNLTITTNNTEIANNLILGLSGLTTWFPGLVIPIGEGSIQTQNQTAYAAAARVPGNWLNGTVESWYENLTVSGTEYDCIAWNFTQDPTLYGKPQTTYLAYDLATGVLVECNTTYTFDFPYIFALQLDSIQTPQSISIPMIALVAGGVGGLVIVALVVLKKR